jgi:hypothetical protein
MSKGGKVAKAEEKKAKAAEMEESEELPFPNARLVKIIRENIDPGKQIKKRVRIEMNKWLGEMAAKVARRMNKHPYTYIDYSMFKEAIAVYEKLEDAQAEKERIIKYLEKIKADCEMLERELGRKLDFEDEL